MAGHAGQGSSRLGSQGARARPANRRVAQWMRDYVRLPGIPDEFIGPDGAQRAVWARFFDAFATLAPAEIERRFGSADRHLREAGVTYRAPGETADRLWPLSHLPLLIDETDWQQLTAGIVQRAELLELVLSDLYGEGRLIAEGPIPAPPIAGSTEYLRPLCAIKPPAGPYLNLYAADVGRGPDGRWWVLGDRTQAPSGAGYALENRLVLSRAFTTLYKSMNVERVAPFFEAFRDSLRASADRDEPRIGLLTPGQFNETYFEHATLARYLGFLLVEGDDLAVSGDRIHIRTVAGLKRLAALRRRELASTMSARKWCDCRRRRCGTMAISRRARSCCGCSRPQRLMAGPSCPAAFAGSPNNSTPARCRWGTVRAPPTSGWSPTRRFRRQRCCRRSIRCGSGASPAWCRAALPTICSGSAAISNAPRRRRGWGRAR